VFILGKLFWPSLMYANKAGAYPSGAPDLENKLKYSTLAVMVDMKPGPNVINFLSNLRIFVIS
jgi:hypothetical protein